MDTILLGLLGLIFLVPIVCWIPIIIYCRKVARRLGYNKDVALLVGFFLPLPAVILYAYYSHKNKRVERIDSTKT